MTENSPLTAPASWRNRTGLQELALEPRPPAPPLADHVAEIRILTPPRDGALVRVENLPDGSTSLLLRVTAHGMDLCLVGPLTRARYKRVEAARVAIVARLRPGRARGIAGVGLDAVTDQVVWLDPLWGLRPAMRLRSELRAARSPDEMVRALERALTERVQSAAPPPRAVEAGVEALTEGAVSVERLAPTLGVSARQLRRAFREHVGMPPKTFARVARFQRARRELEAGRPASIAAVAAGYYDQAHMIAEMRVLAEMTPAAFVQRAEYQPPACRLPDNSKARARNKR